MELFMFLKIRRISLCPQIKGGKERFTPNQVNARNLLSNKVSVKNQAPFRCSYWSHWLIETDSSYRREERKLSVDNGNSGNNHLLLMFPIIELSIFRGLESFQKLFSLLYFLLLPRLIPFVFGCQYFDYARQCSGCCICVKKSESRPSSNKINSRFTVLISSTVGYLGL